VERQGVVPRQVLRSQLLDAVSALPEEEIRGDARPEHGHDEGQVGRFETELLSREAAHDAGPVDLHREEHHDVGQQRHAQPLEDPFDVREGAQCHGEGDAATRHGRPERSRSGVQQMHPLADRHQVGREVEHVGTDQGNEEHHGDACGLRPELRPREGSVDQRARGRPD
jgi:hypothetical protein